jgi:hypothetical protein
MDKESVVYIHTGMLLSHKKNEILSFETIWMKLEVIMLREKSRLRKTNTTCSHFFVEIKKWVSQMKEWSKRVVTRDQEG